MTAIIRRGNSHKKTTLSGIQHGDLHGAQNGGLHGLQNGNHSGHSSGHNSSRLTVSSDGSSDNLSGKF